MEIQSQSAHALMMVMVPIRVMSGYMDIAIMVGVNEEPILMAKQLMTGLVIQHH